MFGSPRINNKNLAGLCRRLALSLEAGIEVRTVWSREADRAIGRQKAPLGAISAAVVRGQSVHEAMAETGRFFPPLVCELVAVGEQTGHLDGIFAQLADYYDLRVRMRRRFLAAITWPMCQLALAVVVIGLLIWVLGMLPRGGPGDLSFDPLGIGLYGDRGLLIYSIGVGSVGLGVWLLIRLTASGVFWTAPLQRFVLRLPVLGGALRTLALARLAWSLHLTMSTGMDVRRGVRLSLQSTRSARYTDTADAIDATLKMGEPIYVAFSSTRVYPSEFLDSLAVGEQSGKLAESMGLLSRQYDDRAQVALATLTRMAGWGVWIIVATIIITLIFRMAFEYINLLDEVSKW